MRPLDLAKVLWRRWRFAQRDRWGKVRLEAHKTEQLRRLREHSYARSPFYPKFHQGLEDRPLEELPVLTKRELMASFDELVTDRSLSRELVEASVANLPVDELLFDRYQVALTSGSTGLRGLFLWDRDEWCTVLASYARANDWAGVRAGLTRKIRMAVVSSRTPWHQSARVAASLETPIVDAIRLDATAPLAETVARLNRHQPQLLVAYASMAGLLAQEQLACRLRISPEAIMCASEVLTEDSRRRIAAAWGKRPFNVYAATEPAGIASECEQHRGLHLYEDLVITEVVDEKYRPVPPGVVGAKILVTVLFSRTQPLIRYEMSDRVCLAQERCPCGRPFALLSAIEGRAEDVLHLPARGGGTIAVHPNLFHNTLEGIGASEWQVEQTHEGLAVRVVDPIAAVDIQALRRAVLDALDAHGVAPVGVRVDRAQAVSRTQIGKAPLIRALAPP
ncbi:MAG: phenylacetate--CoA ligase family protein [Myxococcales bacterium]|nr:phenylacetate--CoA ligase family protein [Myxococcales bacterium]